MTFQRKLDLIVKKSNSLVCAGLDSDIDKTPKLFLKFKHPQFEFNRVIIDATYDLVCAYKPNSAFYEARGADGIKDLKLTCDYLKQKYPHVPIILDAKRADIGSTNKGYAQFAFDYLQVDAITLHAYLGEEALRPFLNRRDKGSIILCRTSNPGAGELQDLTFDSGNQTIKLYQIIAKNVIERWNKNKNCLLVVGATYPQELAEIRQIVGDMTMLIPGIGVQGGDIAKTVKVGLNSKGTGMIINSSRGIIFADDPKEATLTLRDKINYYRN